MSKSLNGFARLTALGLFLALALCATVLAQDEAEAGGATPGALIAELVPAIVNPHAPAGQTWRVQIDLDFSNWSSGSSHNLPVIAAAIALVRQNTGTGIPQDMVPWWTTFLACQNGGPCPVANPGALIYFKGSELFSSTYDWSVVSSVAVVNWWARRAGNSALRDAARLYLRKTWSLYALAADPANIASWFDNTSASGLIVDGPASFLHNCPSGQGPSTFDGPYLALAASRAGGTLFCSDNKRILFAQAIGWPMTKPNPSWEFPPEQKTLRTATLLTAWAALGVDTTYGESVWALNPAEESLLRDQVSSASHTATLLGVINFGETRFKARYHFLGWPGIRATVLERNLACRKCGNVLYASRFDSATRQAQLLYPWKTGEKSGHKQGKAEILPPGPAPLPKRVWAENCTPAIGDECPPPIHGYHWGYIELPSASPTFHIVLGPDEPGHFE